MSFTLTPNMNLPLPVVGQEPGPTYGEDQNNAFTIVDQHTHLPGSGVQITPAALNINTALSLNGQFAQQVAGVTLSAQSVQPAINTVYESGTDLYFVDGLGNNVRITQSGAVAGSPGSIGGLTAPASATYVSGSSTFVWQSNTSIAANMDFGNAIFRNLSPNSTFGVTMQAPAALASNYTLTLPQPAVAQGVLVIDSSGNISSSTVFPIVDSSVAANANIQGSKLADRSVGSTQIALLAITNAELGPQAVTGAKVDANTIANSNLVNSTITLAKIDPSAITAGTYTPTISNYFHSAGGTTPSGGFQFMRVGNTVTVSGLINGLQTDASADHWSIQLTLPIASSAFTLDTDAGGTGCGFVASGYASQAIYAAVGTTNRIVLEGSNPAGPVTDDYVIHFTYRII